MTNKLRGQVSIEIDGKEEFIRMPISALEEIKNHFGIEAKGVEWLDEFLSNANQWDFPNDFVAMFTIGLRKGSMPDADRTLIADSLFVADLQVYMEALVKAFSYSSSGGQSVKKERTQEVPLTKESAQEQVT